MLNHRIRILSSLLLAFIIVNIYGRLTNPSFISPIQADSIKNLLSSIKFNPSSLTKFFTLNISFPENNNLIPLQNKNEGLIFTRTFPPPTNECTGFACKTPTPVQPTRPIQPTSKFSPSPTSPAVVLTKAGSTIIPTASPKPTKKPSPTPTPSPPPITSDTRPGTSLLEIFQEINKRQCIPVALLRAFQNRESGVFFNFNNPSSVIKIYNTYGWWKTGAGDPCFGLGYHTQTGIIPQDSVRAGERCRNAGGNPTDIGIMGILQISQWEQETSRKNTISTLPKNIDRRVLFDNALIFASITKNRIGNPPSDCDDWPDDVVRTAARKHLGSVCEYNYGNGNAGNYCDEILKLYKQYR